MGINGNSCYKTHYFLNASLTIFGQFRQFGTENGRTRINRIERIFFVPYGQKSIKIFFIISGSLSQKYF